MRTALRYRKADWGERLLSARNQAFETAPLAIFDPATGAFYGKAKIISMDDAGAVFQNPAVTPDATPTYCFPFVA